MTASLPLFLVGSAAHCGGPLAKNSASPHAKLPHYTTQPGSKRPAFRHVRYHTYTAGTEPFIPREPPPNIKGLKLVPRFLFPAHYLPRCWRPPKMAPNLMFKRPRLRLSSDAFPSSKGLRVYRLQLILLLRPTLSPFSALLRLTYRLYRSVSYKDGASPP